MKDCIAICREYKNLLAEARLIEKSGDGLEAIKIYLKYIETIDPKRMSD